jgi:hypothetical protein
MKIKFWLLVCALLLLAALPGTTYDFGGKLDNATSPALSVGNATLLQEDKLAVWYETGLLDETLELTVQASFTLPYNYSFSAESGDLTPSPFWNLDLLTLQGEKLLANGLRRSTTWGRFPARDYSGYLLADTLDGLEVAWQQARFTASLAVGTTALQFQPYTSVKMSLADEADTFYTEDDPLSDKLGPPRLIALLELEVPELIGGRDLLLAMAFQQDLRDPDKLPPTGGRLTTQYLGAGLRGTVAPALYCNFFTYLGTGSMLSGSVLEYAGIASALAGASLRWFREDLLFSRAEVKLLFASGDKDFAAFLEGNMDGMATAFQPISRPELALVFSPTLSNLGVLEASYSVKPADKLQLLLKGLVFMRPTSAPVSDGRVDAASDALYLGSEADLVVRWRPYSDLGLACSAGIFLPGSEAFSSAYQDPELEGRIEISFSF